MVRGGILPLCGLETGISKAPPLAQANTPGLFLSRALSLSHWAQSEAEQPGTRWGEPDRAGQPSTLALPGHPCQPTITGRPEPSSPEEGESPVTLACPSAWHPPHPPPLPAACALPLTLFQEQFGKFQSTTCKNKSKNNKTTHTRVVGRVTARGPRRQIDLFLCGVK